jgi:protein-tyrosine phosphatase
MDEDRPTTGRACPRRCLGLPGSYNLRDLGGYPTSGCGQTCWRTVLRSGNLDRLAPAGRLVLLTSGLATVIDLRDPSEVRRHPDVFAIGSAVRYLNLPVVSIDSEVWTAELDERYLLMVDECRTRIRGVLEAIATSRFPLIVHCTAGKDRTGLIVALLLALVGVPAPVIAADYALSEQCLVPFFARVRAQLEARGADLARFERDARAAPETILRVIEHVGSRYGGVAGYLGLPGRMERRLMQLVTV